MPTIPSYPASRSPLDGTELFAGWQNGQQVSLPTSQLAALLSQVVTASAQTAQLAAAAALVSGKLYSDTASAIAATTDGEFFLVRGDSGVFADLYLNSAGVAVEQPNQLPSLAALATKVDVDGNSPFRVIVDATNPEAYGMRGDSIADSKQVDTFFASAVMQNNGAGYCFHGIMTSDETITTGRAGGMGGAGSGKGYSSGMVGNRYEDGPGHGGIFTRTGSGDGSGALGTFQSSGTGAGVTALKQNTNGVPGGPYGTGPALAATNSSEQGEAIDSTTTANNSSPISNVFERQNTAQGIVSRLQLLYGNALTGSLTGQEILVEPASPLTGAHSVTGLSIALNNNVNTTIENVGLAVSNSASGAASSYGVTGYAIGQNSNNFGGYFKAAGAINNFAIYCAEGDAFFNGNVQAPNLPVFEDNASASATLQPGTWYRTAAGQVLVTVAP